MPSWLPIEGWRDVLDIGLVAGFGWLAIRHFRRTQARPALAGLALLAVVFFVARELELRLAEAIFQGFFAVLVLLLVVIFQEDLRRAFEQLGSWRRGPAEAPEESEALDLLVRTVAKLASMRTGALFVLPGREPLDRHLDGGVVLAGRASEPLLLSLFDESSPGHDGAVLLRGSTIERFSIHLPLSGNHAALGPGGTRHAAALGLSERCDAVCVVVSEERGTISVARGGEIHVLDSPEDLVEELRSAFQPETESRRWWQSGVGVDTVTAVAGAVALWMVIVPGSHVSETTVAANVEVVNLPDDVMLETVEPSTVEVTLRGLRRDVLLAQRAGVQVQVDSYLARLGRRTFAISEQDVSKPEALSVVALTPQKVRIFLAPASAPDGS